MQELKRCLSESVPTDWETKTKTEQPVSGFPRALLLAWQNYAFHTAGGCGRSIQRYNRADSVPVNEDQACLDEGFLGTGKAQGLPPPNPAPPLSASAVWKRELTSCVRLGKDAFSCAFSECYLSTQALFPYQGHVWWLSHCVDLQNTLLNPFFIVFFFLLIQISFSFSVLLCFLFCFSSPRNWEKKITS